MIGCDYKLYFNSNDVNLLIYSLEQISKNKVNIPFDKEHLDHVLESLKNQRQEQDDLALFKEYRNSVTSSKEWDKVIKLENEKQAELLKELKEKPCKMKGV